MMGSVISYSQFAMYHQCPKQWKLMYIDKAVPRSQSIHATFGTAMHRCIQSFLKTRYNESTEKANKINFEVSLMENLKKCYLEDVKKNSNVHFSSDEELAGFYDDGIKILNYFKKHNKEYFPENFKLIGIEIPLRIQASEKNENVMMIGYIDIGFEDLTNKIYIKDIKTSTSGWNEYKKKDKLTKWQVLLYKKYYSKQVNRSENDVEVDFFILRRKVMNVYTKRIQEWKPTFKQEEVNEFQKGIDGFVGTVFDEEGNKRADIEYPAIVGEKKKNCTYCPFKDLHIFCNPKDRK